MVPNQGLRNILPKAEEPASCHEKGSGVLLHVLGANSANCSLTWRAEAKQGGGSLEGPSGFPLPGLNLWMRRPWSSRVCRADGSGLGTWRGVSFFLFH